MNRRTLVVFIAAVGLLGLFLGNFQKSTSFNPPVLEPVVEDEAKKVHLERASQRLLAIVDSQGLALWFPGLWINKKAISNTSPRRHPSLGDGEFTLPEKPGHYHASFRFCDYIPSRNSLELRSLNFPIHIKKNAVVAAPSVKLLRGKMLSIALLGEDEYSNGQLFAQVTDQQGRSTAWSRVCRDGWDSVSGTITGLLDSGRVDLLFMGQSIDGLQIARMSVDCRSLLEHEFVKLKPQAISHVIILELPSGIAGKLILDRSHMYTPSSDRFGSYETISIADRICKVVEKGKWEVQVFPNFPELWIATPQGAIAIHSVLKNLATPAPRLIVKPTTEHCLFGTIKNPDLNFDWKFELQLQGGQILASTLFGTDFCFPLKPNEEPELLKVSFAPKNTRAFKLGHTFLVPKRGKMDLEF